MDKYLRYVHFVFIETNFKEKPVIRSVKFVSVPVKDQERALKFYTEKLGMMIMTDQPFDDSQRWIELGIKGADTRVILFTPRGHEDRVGSFVNMAYESGNVEKTYEELKSRGVEFRGPPEKTPWGFMAIFNDSEGNSFCLSSGKG